MKVVVFQEDSSSTGRFARFRGGAALTRRLALPCVGWPRSLHDACAVIAHDRVVAERAAFAGVPALLLAGAFEVVADLPDRVTVVRSQSAFVADLLLADLLDALERVVPGAVVRTKALEVALGGERVAEIAHGGVRARNDSVGVDVFRQHADDWIGDPRDLWFLARDTFDTVLLHEVFTAEADREQAFHEALRIVRPGGEVVVAHPAAAGAGTTRHRKPVPKALPPTAPPPPPEVSVLLVAERSGDPAADARALITTIDAARSGLHGVAHEILVLLRDPIPGAETAVLEGLARAGTIRIRRDARPWTWPRRAELLRSAARGKALLVLAPGVRSAEGALAALHTAARARALTLAIPERVTPSGGARTAPATLACLWLDASRWPFGLGDRAPHQTRHFLTTLGTPTPVSTGAVEGPGLGGLPLPATRVAPWRFDAALPSATVPARRILVACLRSFGDCVLATAPLAALRAAHPRAEITVLTEQPYAALFVHDPAVDVVLAVPACSAAEIFWHEDMALVAALAERGPFDRLAFLSDRLDNLSYVHAGIPMHGFYCVQAGVPEGADRAPGLALPRSARAAAARRLAAHGIHGRYVALHTRAGWEEKTPPAALFAAIVDEVVLGHGLPVVVVGGPGEFRHPRAVTLAGEQDLLESLGVIAGAHVFVGPDSGSLHAASALGVATLGLFAGTGARVSPTFGPRRAVVQSPSSCHLPCGTSPCREARPCAPGITLEHVRPPLAALVRGEESPSEWVGAHPARWLASPAGPQWMLGGRGEPAPEPPVDLLPRQVCAREDALPVHRIHLDTSPAALVAHQRAFLELRDRLIPGPPTDRYREGSKETNPWQRPSARSATS